jgi:hypothetical protein
MQKKMLVLSAAIMTASLSGGAIGEHHPDDGMMHEPPPECMAAMDIMAEAGVDPDNLSDHPDVEAQVMATGATEAMCGKPEDHMMPPMGDDGMMPPMGDDGMMPPMGDDGMMGPPPEGDMMPPMGDDGMMGPPPEGDMMPPMGDDGMMGPPPEGDMMGPPPMEP